MDKLLRAPLSELSDWLSSGEITSLALTKAYLSQIKKREDKIGAYLHLDEMGALETAKKVDAQRAQGMVLSPIAGIPMALKDNICTMEMPTTCASKMLQGYMSPFDAHVVTRLKEQGAVILGKLNMDEFGMGASTENSAFKTTQNPVDTRRVPGGSSGGSAAAVAAFEAAYSLGSDTGGSVRQPAAFCGLAGLKPTYGRVSRSGLIAFASSLDQIGPIAKTVEDLALVFTAIAGKDPGDGTSVAVPLPRIKDMLKRDVSKLKIGIPMAYLERGVQQEVKDAILHAAEVYKQMGVIVEAIDIKDMSYALPAYYLISSAEASSNLSRFDGVQYGYRAKEAEDIETLFAASRGHGFGKEVKRRILLGTYALSSGYYDAYYQKALKVRRLIKASFDEVFKSYDAIMTPVAPTTAYEFGRGAKGPVEVYLGDVYTVPVNIAGIPAVSLNCGWDNEGLPIGMQLIGDAFNEATILALGHAFEKAVKV